MKSNGFRLVMIFMIFLLVFITPIETNAMGPNGNTEVYGGVYIQVFRNCRIIVQDTNGNRVGNVIVYAKTAQNVPLGTEPDTENYYQIGITDSNGVLEIKLVKGTYDFKISKSGYETAYFYNYEVEAERAEVEIPILVLNFSIKEIPKGGGGGSSYHKSKTYPAVVTTPKVQTPPLLEEVIAPVIIPPVVPEVTPTENNQGKKKYTYRSKKEVIEEVEEETIEPEAMKWIPESIITWFVRGRFQTVKDWLIWLILSFLCLVGLVLTKYIIVKDRNEEKRENGKEQTIV